MTQIVHMTTVHRPFDTRIFHKECCTLADAGYRVSLIARCEQPTTVDQIEMLPLPHYSHRLARMLLGTWAAYRTARRINADLYHFHDPELLPIGVLLKWTTRAKVVYDAHENYAKQLSGRSWLPFPLRKVLPRLAGVIEQMSVKSLDAVVCATEHIAAIFPDSKAVVVKNYPLTEMAHLPPSEEPYRADNYQIVYTGGWSLHRGVTQIIQALEHVQTPQCRLILLGRCVDPEVQTDAEKLPGFAKVDYLGLVPYHRLYKFMQTAAIGMVCNQPQHDYDKGQPNKLFEYMSAGLPVIASDFPLWREIVAGNQCGLNIDSTDPRQIAQAIDKLLADADLRRRMGENGRRAVLQTYNWDTQAQKLLNLYKELLP